MQYKLLLLSDTSIYFKDLMVLKKKTNSFCIPVFGSIWQIQLPDVNITLGPVSGNEVTFFLETFMSDVVTPCSVFDFFPEYESCSGSLDSLTVSKSTVIFWAQSSVLIQRKWELQNLEEFSKA